MTRNLLFDCNGETAARAVTQVLVRHGLQVVRSFDLHSALARHTDYGCPNNATEPCAAQFIVLLVYDDPATGSERAPVVVTTHCRDRQAEAQIVQDTNDRPNECLAQCVGAALLEAALSVQRLPGPMAKAAADARAIT